MKYELINEIYIFSVQIINMMFKFLKCKCMVYYLKKIMHKYKNCQAHNTYTSY